MQIYSRADIANAVTLDHRALAAVEAGFDALGRNQVSQPPIMSLEILQANGEVDVKTAYIQGHAAFAIKVSTGFFDNPAKGLPTGNGLMLVLSAATGVVQAVLLDEGYLTNVRTALAGALAAHHLARPDSRRVTIVGAGLQAALQIAALKLVRPIEHVDIWARDSFKASDFALRLGADNDLSVQVHQHLADACAEADIIVTATPAREPLLNASLLPAGVHVTAMGSDSPYKQELDISVLQAADWLVVDSVSQSQSNGELKAWSGPLPDNLVTLGEIVAGTACGRGGSSDITLCDLTGTGVQDSAIAEFALKQLAGLDAG